MPSTSHDLQQPVRNPERLFIGGRWVKPSSESHAGAAGGAPDNLVPPSPTGQPCAHLGSSAQLPNSQHAYFNAGTRKYVPSHAGVLERAMWRKTGDPVPF